MDKNKFIIVTGGSSGLGFEIAKNLLRKNKNIIIIGRDIDKLKKVKVKL